MAKEFLCRQKQLLVRSAVRCPSCRSGTSSAPRRTIGTSFEPAVHWVYTPELEAAYEQLRASGANITEPLEKKPWGLTQFTVEDLDGNRFHFHRD